MSRYTPEDAASVLTAHDEPHEDLDAWPSVSPAGNTASITLKPMIEDRVGSHPDDKAAEHFTAVVVEGDQPPIILPRPETPGEHGLWDIDIYVDCRTVMLHAGPPHALDPRDARLIAAHLAALADLAEREATA